MSILQLTDGNLVRKDLIQLVTYFFIYDIPNFFKRIVRK